MARCFERVAEQIIFDEKKKISDIEIITDVEKYKIINDFNRPYKLYNEEMTLHQLFEKQVYLNGSNIALIYGDKKITYDELNKKANQLARRIRNILDSKYNNKLSVVSVRMDKSIEMIIAILAVLKSSACYLPIDSKYPLERVKYMINDSSSKIILTQSFLEGFSNFDGIVLNVDDEDLFSGVSSNLDTYTTSESLAYIIYTSGTTGNPKGILIEHRNVISYIKTFNDLFFINQESITLQQASISFDGFVEEVYTVLTTGGKVVIPKDDEIKDAEVLREIIINNNINILSCSPLILDKFNNLEPMKSVNTFLSSSDILRSKYYDKIIKYSDVYNMYGPSETTVCSTVYKCDGKEQDIVPIGKPINNYNVYIMNDSMNLLPIGVPGEIYIGGNGVARGYLNTDISNKDRFINNNFTLNGRLYRTGDIGMWTDSGDIVYIGRKDDQIKIRGYRIDIREIESELLKLDNITNVSITIINNESDEKEIVAYIVANKKMTISEIRNKLKNTLPEYMIPSYFVQIDNIPMNQNGKVDKKILLKVKNNLQTGNAYVAPSDENEEMVMNLFKEILDVDIEISMKDTFFELGGNSIKLAILANRIFEIFNIKINIVDLLKYNTVEDIAKLIKNKFKNSREEVMVFNENKERILFCFPPIIGYGIIYTQLAKELSDYRINAFNFIEDSNIIQLYADYIIKSQQTGEYELFGYSAGGNLAFEVAKELEKRNKTVTKIIMLDSDIATESIVTNNINSENYRRKEIKMLLENNKVYRLFAGEIMDKTSKFSDYFNANITNGKINSDIYLIKSDIEDLKKDYSWGKFTNKQLISIEGRGEHNSMLEDGNALKNINIIRQIIE